MKQKSLVKIIFFNNTKIINIFVFFTKQKSVFLLWRLIKNIHSWMIKWNINFAWLYYAGYRRKLVYADGGQGKICVKENLNSWFYSFGGFKILSVRFINLWSVPANHTDFVFQNPWSKIGGFDWNSKIKISIPLHCIFFPYEQLRRSCKHLCHL